MFLQLIVNCRSLRKLAVSWLLFLVLTLTCAPSSQTSEAQAIYVAYPQESTIVQAPSSFIVGAVPIGHALTCQGESVRINANGFFAHVVPLKHGDNSFLLRLDDGTEKMVTVKREPLPAAVSEATLRIASFEPSQDLGVSKGDPIAITVRATPQSTVTVFLGSKQLALAPQGTPQAKYDKTPRAYAHVARGQDVAYGKVYKRRSAAESDLYTGFYRVGADDHWQGIRPKVVLQRASQQIVFVAPNRVSKVDEARMAQTAHDQCIVRLGPGLARTTPLDEGVRLEVDGWIGSEMRCRYSPNKHVWVNLKDLLFENPREPGTPLVSTTAPLAVARTINIENTDYGQSVKIPLDQRLPYQVEQKMSPNGLVLRIYGVTADTDWVTAATESYPKVKGRNDMVDHVFWKQPADDIYEVNVHLLGAKQWGYKAHYEDTTLCLEVKRSLSLAGAPRVLTGIKVCVDPGHGGSEHGAIGCSGVPESAINFAIAQKLKELLENLGAQVLLTRLSDKEFCSLDDRVSAANKWGADLFISVHNNALPDGADPWKEHGSSAYWYHPQALPLARCLKDALVQELDFNDCGCRFQNLAVARTTNMPAALAEVGFMINPDEYAKLIDPIVQQKSAQALCDGLIKYLSE